MVEDLWPEKLESAKIRPPVAILKEQASLLGKKTKNVVEGRVASISDIGSDNIEHAFFLAAPALGDYRYRLFTMSHDIRMYPVNIALELEILAEVDPKKYSKYPMKSLPSSYRSYVEAGNEAEFLALLKKIFAATKTTQIISAMLAQSTS